MYAHQKISTLFATTALATVTGASAAMADPADWAGFYVGGMYSITGGEYSYAGDDYDIDQPIGGGFVGFNAAFGSVVVGAEYDLNFGFAAGDDYDGMDNVQDLRIRVGTTFDNALIYGAIGVSSAHVYGGGSPDYDVSGVNYGIGVDYAVSDNLFVGVDYTIRNMGGGVDGDYVDVRGMSTLSIRVGYKF